MTLKDLLKKRDNVKESETSEPNLAPEFTIIRSDTYTHEVIQPPSFASDTAPALTRDRPSNNKRPSRFRSSSSVSKESKGERSFSQFLHRHAQPQESRSSSVNVPSDLPSIDDVNTGREDREAQWEERATRLAKENLNLRSSPQPEELPIINPETSRTQRLDFQAYLGQAKGYVRDAQSDVWYLHGTQRTRVDIWTG